VQAWLRWRDGKPLELLDPALGDSYSREQVMRCIHVSLLCVQKDAADRPTMASILHTLNSSSVTLESPQQPAFFLRTKAEPNMPVMDMSSGQSISISMPWSVNEESVTEPNPR
jgi:hypothetical protein